MRKVVHYIRALLVWPLLACGGATWHLEATPWRHIVAWLRAAARRCTLAACAQLICNTFYESPSLSEILFKLTRMAVKQIFFMNFGGARIFRLSNLQIVFSIWLAAHFYCSKYYWNFRMFEDMNNIQNSLISLVKLDCFAQALWHWASPPCTGARAASFTALHWHARRNGRRFGVSWLARCSLWLHSLF